MFTKIPIPGLIVLLRLGGIDSITTKGPFKCYVMQLGGGMGGVCFPGKKHYIGVRFNVIRMLRFYTPQ